MLLSISHHELLWRAFEEYHLSQNDARTNISLSLCFVEEFFLGTYNISAELSLI